VGHRRRLIGRSFATAAALAGLLGTTQTSAPSALAQLVAGTPATTLTFAPIGGPLRPMVVPGKPTIVIAFASWCSACFSEMERNLQDYARYKDRVTFLGIDYVDSASGGDAMIAKFAIPFPVERLDLNDSATGTAGVVGSSADPILLHGVTPETLDAILPSLQSQMPALYPTLADIDAQCAGLSEAACLAYAHSRGVALDASRHLVAPPKPVQASASAYVSLPVTYVIAANGTVLESVEGYDAGTDPIPGALAKLGIQ
jgi:thiol-disulfide isomerase/thioredoxin